MSIEIIAYSPAHETAWEQFCAGAVNATFLHTRRFLNIQGDRFIDLSVLIAESGKVVGVFPAAASPSAPEMVVSHPGITFGGIIHQGRLCGMRMIETFTALSAHYRQRGYQRLLYKAPPHIYAAPPAQDDLYALFRLGAPRVRCDLSSAVDLDHRRPAQQRRRRGLNKARKVVTLSSDAARLAELWAVIAQNLARKHDARPVHSEAELALLADRFPDQIAVRCALLEGRVEAGIVLFNSSAVWHAQYIAATERAYDVSALDAVFDAAITEAEQAGVRYFDFGTSNLEGGMVLNDGLYSFKSGFGGGGVAYEFYELEFGR